MPVRGLIVKGGTLNLSRRNCFRVLCKNRRHDHPNYGKWEPISRCGFTVVCASKLEAEELILLAGGAMFAPPWWCVGDDDRYLRWLKGRHFLVQPYEASGKNEVMFGEFVRGWVPSGAEFTSGISESMYSSVLRPMIQQALAGTG